MEIKMAKKEIKFPNREQAIKSLMYKKGIKKQKELLLELYKVYFYEQYDTSDKFLNAQESNFSSMKKGERDFTLEFKYALSELAETSFSNLTDPKEEFDPFGIRYAAMRDDVKLYKKLTEDTDDDDAPIYRDDEFRKNVFDYILEYKSENGFKFIVNDPELLRYFRYSYIKEMLIWAAERDDKDLFKRIMARDSRICDCVHSEEAMDEIYDSILGSDKILRMFCEPIVRDGRVCGSLPYDFAGLLIRAIKSDRIDKADELFGIYESFVELQVNEYLKEFGHVDQRSMDIDTEWYRGRHDKLVGAFRSGKYIELIDFGWHSDRDNEKEAVGKIAERYKDRYEALLPESIALKITEDPYDLPFGGEYVDRREFKLYSRKESDLGHEVMRLMTYENDIPGIIKYYEPLENGTLVTELEYHKRSWIDSISASPDALIPVISKIHEISEKTLGEGRVYAYADYGKAKIWDRMDSGESDFALGGFIGNTRITSPTEDLVAFILDFTDISKYNRKSKELIAEIEGGFALYYNPDYLKSFGDNLLLEIDKRIGELDKKKRIVLYEKYMHTRTFVEIYLDELNSLGQDDRTE